LLVMDYFDFGLGQSGDKAEASDLLALNNQ
jgi:hypothetical protein